MSQRSHDYHMASLSHSLQIIIMVIFAFLIGAVYFDLGGKKVSSESLNNVIYDR